MTFFVGEMHENTIQAPFILFIIYSNLYPAISLSLTAALELLLIIMQIY